MADTKKAIEGDKNILKLQGINQGYKIENFVSKGHHEQSYIPDAECDKFTENSKTLPLSNKNALDETLQSCSLSESVATHSLPIESLFSDVKKITLIIENNFDENLVLPDFVTATKPERKIFSEQDSDQDSSFIRKRFVLINEEDVMDDELETVDEVSQSLISESERENDVIGILKKSGTIGLFSKNSFVKGNESDVFSNYVLRKLEKVKDSPTNYLELKENNYLNSCNKMLHEKDPGEYKQTDYSTNPSINNSYSVSHSEFAIIHDTEIEVSLDGSQKVQAIEFDIASNEETGVDVLTKDLPKKLPTLNVEFQEVTGSTSISEKYSLNDLSCNNFEKTSCKALTDLNKEKENEEQSMAQSRSLNNKANQDSFLANQDSFLANQDSFLANQDSFLANQDSFLANQDSFLANQDSFLANQDSFLDNQDSFLANQDSFLANQDSSFQCRKLDDLKMTLSPPASLVDSNKTTFEVPEKLSQNSSRDIKSKNYESIDDNNAGITFRALSQINSTPQFLGKYNNFSSCAIIDNGSGSIKCGLSSFEIPLVVPSLVGRPNYTVEVQITL